MFQSLKVKSIELLNSTDARTVIIISILVIAALVGGAPSDTGGT